MPTNYPPLHEIMQRYRVAAHSNPELRLGQFFCNEYGVENSELFYTRDNAGAVKFINEILHPSSH